jgi:hypothetical protein
MNTITETTEIERKKLAFQIIENNVRTLEDGYRSLKWYSPCKIDYNSDVDVETQIIKYYKDKVKHSKKVLEIVKKYLPKEILDNFTWWLAKVLHIVMLLEF